MTVSVASFPDGNVREGARLYRSAFNAPPWNDEWTPDAAETRLREIIESPGYRGYGASVGGDLVGLAMGSVEQWYDGAQFYLRETCVAPDRRRQGVGTTLLAHLTDELRDEGVARMYLLTMRESPARAFYEANGFRADETVGVQFRRLQ